MRGDIRCDSGAPAGGDFRRESAAPGRVDFRHGSDALVREDCVPGPFPEEGAWARAGCSAWPAASHSVVLILPLEAARLAPRPDAPMREDVRWGPGAFSYLAIADIAK